MNGVAPEVGDVRSYDASRFFSDKHDNSLCCSRYFARLPGSMDREAVDLSNSPEKNFIKEPWSPFIFLPLQSDGFTFTPL